jgi:hypothetical protein
MKTSSESMQRDHEEAGEPQPRRLQVVLALGQQLAERRRARRQAEAEEVERGQRGDRAADRMKGRKVSVATMALGRMWRNMMWRRDARAPGGAHVVEVAAAQELGAHHADQAHPGEQQQQPSSHQKLGCTTLARMISR